MLRIGLESPKELGIMGLADGGDGGYADETLLKCAAALESPDALCLSACDREQLHVSLRRACMSVFFSPLHAEERLEKLQQAHLNSVMVPDWESRQRLPGRDAQRLFLDLLFPRRGSGEEERPDQ